MSFSLRLLIVICMPVLIFFMDSIKNLDGQRGNNSAFWPKLCTNKCVILIIFPNHIIWMNAYYMQEICTLGVQRSFSFEFWSNLNNKATLGVHADLQLSNDFLERIICKIDLEIPFIYNIFVIKCICTDSSTIQNNALLKLNVIY